MRQLILLLIIIPIIHSCEYSKVSVDPHYPNVGITVGDLKKNGWELTTVDHGICVYSKINYSQNLVFYLDTNDTCELVNSQEIYITLNYTHKYEMETLELNGRPINEKDLRSEIDSILHKFNAKVITDLNFITPCRFKFLSENENGVKIEWSLNLCQEKNTISSYYELDK